MRFSSLIMLSWLIIFAMSVGKSAAMQVELPHVNVLTDPSLSIPMSILARLYAKQVNISISTSYASSIAQSDNIVAGLEADVFITTREKTLEMLKSQGLVDVYSKTAVTKNRLSMVTYAANTLELILIPKLPLTNILERVDPGFSFTIGDPSYQNVGFYGLRALRNYEMAGELEPYFLFIRSNVDMHRTIQQKGGYGLMYQSEAMRNPAIKILGTFPEVAHSSILYYGMVVAGENMEFARSFLQFLTTPEAQDVFVQHGFEPLKAFESESGQLARGSTSNASTNPL